MFCKRKYVVALIIFLVGWVCANIFSGFWLLDSSSSSIFSLCGVHLFGELFSIPSSFHGSLETHNAKGMSLFSATKITDSNSSTDISITSSTISINSKYRDGVEAAAYSARILPIFPPSSQTSWKSHPDEATVTSEKLLVLLDWPLDDKLFTRENYLSLESLLVTLPDAMFRVLLPTSKDAYLQKNGNLFSVHHFVRYQKVGYDIKVLPVGSMEQSLGPGFGSRYWNEYRQACCQQCTATCRRGDTLQPFHLMTFLRLCKLWRRGGIAADFSYLFLGPVVDTLKSARFQELRNENSGSSYGSGVQGYFMKSSCDDRDNKEEWQEEQEQEQDSSLRGEEEEEETLVEEREEVSEFRWKSSRCMTSSLFVFTTPKSSVIECVLQQYDNTSFVRCVEGDEELQGAGCLQEVFAACFSSLRVNNYLSLGPTPSSSDHPAADTSSTGSVVLETFPSYTHHELTVFFLSTWYPWQLLPSTRVLYLGEIAREGTWRRWEVDHSSSNMSLFAAVKTRVDSQLMRHKESQSAQCGLPCHPFTERPPGPALGPAAAGPNTTVKAGRARARYSYHTDIESASCAPAVAVTGFVQAGAQTLSNLLLHHPQALPPLGYGTPPAASKKQSPRVQTAGGDGGAGGGRDEEDEDDGGGLDSNTYSSCYRSVTHNSATHRRKSLLRRPWCFAFIDAPAPPGTRSLLSSSQHSAAVLSGEDKIIPSRKVNFFNVDRDVRYATDLLAPYTMVADNPNMKIIFAVRNPIERMYFHFLRLLKSFPNVDFNEVVQYGFSRNGKFGQMRRLITSSRTSNSTLNNYEAIIRTYYTPPVLSKPGTTSIIEPREQSLRHRPQRKLSSSLLSENNAQTKALSPAADRSVSRLLAAQTSVVDANSSKSPPSLVSDVVHSATMIEDIAAAQGTSDSGGASGGGSDIVPPLKGVPAGRASLEDVSRLTSKVVLPGTSLGGKVTDRKKWYRTYENLPYSKKLMTLASILFSHSIYLPAILHFGYVMGNSNLMVVNMDSADMKSAGTSFDKKTTNYAHRLQKVATQVYRFSGLCPHYITSHSLVEAMNDGKTSGKSTFQSRDKKASSLKYSDIVGGNSIERQASQLNERQKISQSTLHQLVTFFQPFNAELSRIIGQDLSHWSNESSFRDSHDVYMAGGGGAAAEGSSGHANPDISPQQLSSNGTIITSKILLLSDVQNISREVDWFDDVAKDRLREQLQLEEASLLQAQASAESESESENEEREWGIGGLLSAGEEILKALLPSKAFSGYDSASEDSRHNTTIGMFAMF